MALPDLNFGEILNESTNRVAGVLLVAGASKGIYGEAFKEICLARKLDPEKTTIKDLDKKVKADLLRQVVVVALRRGHGRKQVFAILSRSGILSEKMQTKIWNSAKKAETNRIFKQVFGISPAAVEPKAAVTKLLSGDHDANFVYTTKTKTINILSAIGFTPFIDNQKRGVALKSRGGYTAPDPTTPEEQEAFDAAAAEYNAKYIAEYDDIKAERLEVYAAATEMAAEVNETVKILFGAKDRVSRNTDDFGGDDKLLAAMTVGGHIIAESDLDDEEDDFAGSTAEKSE